ncbi:MAG: hypothetical protein AAB968_03475 [Patescibacteria group bacterium]
MLLWFLVSIILIVGAFFVGRSRMTRVSESSRASHVDSYAELRDVESISLSFDELSAFFKKLAQEKGAEYAFGALRVAKFPADTDLHLLGHVVGDELYKQKGLAGIAVCTNDFRNACSHSIVVGLLLEKGESALPHIAQACRQAPGGSGAYTMCYHGLGHGILAYVGYNLDRAITLCGKTGTQGEAPQCIGGAMMEIISGGGHNRELWARERVKYLIKNAPLTPCTSNIMPADGRIFCLIYITPYLWEAAGADLGHPTDKDFSASFKFCDTLGADDIAGRDACFGGFGKEFTTLANARDIRNVDQMNDQQMRQVYDWCMLAGIKNGTAACLTHAMNSLYWGGENKPAGAIRFCGVISDEYQQRSCFLNLIQSVHTYQSNARYRQDFCKQLPEEYVRACS